MEGGEMPFGKKTILMRGQYEVYREEGTTFVEVVRGHHLGALFMIKSNVHNMIDPRFNLTVFEDVDVSMYKLKQNRSYWMAWHMS